MSEEAQQGGQAGAVQLEGARSQVWGPHCQLHDPGQSQGFRSLGLCKRKGQTRRCVGKRSVKPPKHKGLLFMKRKFDPTANVLASHKTESQRCSYRSCTHRASACGRNQRGRPSLRQDTI